MIKHRFHPLTVTKTLDRRRYEYTHPVPSARRDNRGAEVVNKRINPKPFLRREIRGMEKCEKKSNGRGGEMREKREAVQKSGRKYRAGSGVYLLQLGGRRRRRYRVSDPGRGEVRRGGAFANFHKNRQAPPSIIELPIGAEHIYIYKRFARRSGPSKYTGELDRPNARRPSV